MKKRTYYICGVVCLIAAAILLWIAFKPVERTETPVVTAVQENILKNQSDTVTKQEPEEIRGLPTSTVFDISEVQLAEISKEEPESQPADSNDSRIEETSTGIIPAGDESDDGDTEPKNESDPSSTDNRIETTPVSEIPEGDEADVAEVQRENGSMSQPTDSTESRNEMNPTVMPTEENKPDIAEGQQVKAPETNKVKYTRVGSYKSPVDFEGLQKMNPDIYSWLYIPKTNINYPVCQRADDDQFYLNHGENGKNNPAGALFTEATYNTTDYKDSMTVIYGHDLANGTMFGNAQYYFETKEEAMKNSEFIVFLPDRELHYTLYTALRFNKYHLIEMYDANEEENELDWFIHDISNSHTIGAYVNEEVVPTSEDHFLVLSTCLKGNSNMRFIVVGVLTEVIS